MSSYELLELIEFLPEDSAYRSARRGGEFSQDELVKRETFNELARLRATMHAVHGGKRYDPPEFKSVAKMIDEHEDAVYSEERREGFFSFADRTADFQLAEFDADDEMVEVS